MLLGIDIGTSACKTTILDSATGRIVATARHPLNYLYPDSVRAEIDAEDLWHSVTSVLRQMSAQYPKEVAALKAAAVSIVFPTLLPLSADNTPLCNAMMNSTAVSAFMPWNALPAIHLRLAQAFCRASSG